MKYLYLHANGLNRNCVGEVDSVKKSNLLKNAAAFLNPICWDEPFGLVVPEANACGTPVVAFNRGSMSEIIKDGQNGFLCPADDVDSMAQAVTKILNMEESETKKLRQECRSFANRFSVEKMVENYTVVYQEAIDDWKTKNG